MPTRSDNPILAIDCASTESSIALGLGGAIHERQISHGRQAAELVPAIDALLKEYGVAYADLSCLLATTGPGSFTGLRIALATLHGLALAHGTPVKTITALESVAWDVATESVDFHIALYAGKGEVFLQRFTVLSGKPVAQGQIILCQPEDAASHAPLYGNHGGSPRSPRAATLCRIAPHLAEMPLAEAMPLYIRPPDAIPGTLPAWLLNT